MCPRYFPGVEHGVVGLVCEMPGRGVAFWVGGDEGGEGVFDDDGGAIVVGLGMPLVVDGHESEPGFGVVAHPDAEHVSGLRAAGVDEA